MADIQTFSTVVCASWDRCPAVLFFVKVYWVGNDFSLFLLWLSEDVRDKNKGLQYFLKLRIPKKYRMGIIFWIYILCVYTESINALLYIKYLPVYPGRFHRILPSAKTNFTKKYCSFFGFSTTNTCCAWLIILITTRFVNLLCSDTYWTGEYQLQFTPEPVLYQLAIHRGELQQVWYIFYFACIL